MSLVTTEHVYITGKGDRGSSTPGTAWPQVLLLTLGRNQVPLCWPLTFLFMLLPGSGVLLPFWEEPRLLRGCCLSVDVCHNQSDRPSQHSNLVTLLPLLKKTHCLVYISNKIIKRTNYENMQSLHQTGVPIARLWKNRSLVIIKGGINQFSGTIVSAGWAPLPPQLLSILGVSFLIPRCLPSGHMQHFQHLVHPVILHITRIVT